MEADDADGGQLPLLGELALPHAHRLLRHSINPRMDLVCLVSIDPTSASASGSGAQGPGGIKLSATQLARARLIAMARARAIGGAAAAAAAAAGDASAGAPNGEPKRGPPLLVSLFRMEGAAVKVWQTAVAVQPTLFEPVKTSDGKYVEEDETVAVGDVAWSPDGTRLALSLTYTRTSSAATAGPSSNVPNRRHAHLLQVMSVQDGGQLSAIASGTRPGPGAARRLQWTPLPVDVAALEPVHSADSTPPSTPFSLAKIHSMPPLPLLDVVALEKVGTSQNAAMPYYMRAQQQIAGIGSAGAAAQQAIDNALPSEQARLTGRGPLARLGSLFLPGEVTELGLFGTNSKPKDGKVVESTGTLYGRRTKARQLSMLSAAECGSKGSSQTALEMILDGTASLGKASIRQDEDAVEWRPQSVSFSDDLGLASILLAHDRSAATRTALLHLPARRCGSQHQNQKAHFPSMARLLKEIAPPTYFHPSLHLARLGSYLCLYLTYTLDAAKLCGKMWTAETARQRPHYSLEGTAIPGAADGPGKTPATASGGTAEWIRIVKESARTEGADTKADLLIVLLTGRASPAVESLLLNTVTQGMLRNMEGSTKDTLSHIRNVCADSILPACERVRILVSEVRGCARWSQRFGPLFSDKGSRDAQESSPAIRELDELHRLTEDAIKLCQGIVHQAQRELLALDEFYQWWRFERERQDHLRQHKEDPHLGVIHDVLAVTDFVNRGFINPKLASHLDGGTVEEPAPIQASGVPTQTSGLGITMDLDADQSAVLGPDGRVVEPASAPSLPKDRPEDVMQTEIQSSDLRKTLHDLKMRVLEKRKAGASTTPMFPLPSGRSHALRAQAKDLFAGATSAYDRPQARDPLDGKTLEGTLWQLTRGVADVLGPAMERTMPAYTGIQLGEVIEPSVLGFNAATLEREVSVLTSRPSNAKAPGQDETFQRGNCLVRQRFVQRPVDDARGKGRTGTYLLSAYVSAVAPSTTPSPTEGDPQVVLVRQQIGLSNEETSPTLAAEATRILLPGPVLAAEFYNDDALLLLFPNSERANAGAIAAQTSARLHSLDLRQPFDYTPIGGTSAVPIPTMQFEPRRSARLDPNLDNALGRLSHLVLPHAAASGSEGAGGRPAGTEASASASVQGRMFSICAERRTAVSMLPLASALVDAAALPSQRTPGQPSSSSSLGVHADLRESGGGAHRRVYDEAVGRVVQYWDLAELSR